MKSIKSASVAKRVAFVLVAAVVFSALTGCDPVTSLWKLNYFGSWIANSLTAGLSSLSGLGSSVGL